MKRWLQFSGFFSLGFLLWALGPSEAVPEAGQVRAEAPAGKPAIEVHQSHASKNKKHSICWHAVTNHHPRNKINTTVDDKKKIQKSTFTPLGKRQNKAIDHKRQ